MAYRLYYHPDIKREDLPRISREVRERIRQAIEGRLLIDPERYGEPLRRGLQGYRKLRVGDYRVVYKVEKESILILKIGHRKEVYQRVYLRVGKQ